MCIHLPIVSCFDQGRYARLISAGSRRAQRRFANIQALSRKIREDIPCLEYQRTRRISVRRSKSLEQDFSGGMDPIVPTLPPFRANVRPYIYNALKTLRTAHPQIWKDEEVKNVHYILAKPWDDKFGEESLEDTHTWWWKVDEERRRKEKQAGLEEPRWA